MEPTSPSKSRAGGGGGGGGGGSEEEENYEDHGTTAPMSPSKSRVAAPRGGGAGGGDTDTDVVFRRKCAYLVCDGQLEEWEVADLLGCEQEAVTQAVADYLARGEAAFDDGGGDGAMLTTSSSSGGASSGGRDSDDSACQHISEVWPDRWPELPAIQTMARIRPLSEREKGVDSGICVEAPSKVEILFKLNERELKKQAVSADFKRTKMKEFMSFPVHEAFASTSNQDEVYDACCKPLLSKVMNGYNGCVLAYGQTGAGKTFTMEGAVRGWGTLARSDIMKNEERDINNSDRLMLAKQKRKDQAKLRKNGGLERQRAKDLERKRAEEAAFAEGDKPGIIPLMVGDLFRGIDRLADSMDIEVKITYIEIYMETVVDLLALPEEAGNSRPPDIVNERNGRGVFVQNAREVVVGSLEEVMQLLQEGFANRRVGETEMNAKSSRSHAVLSLYITSKERSDEEGYTQKKSKVHLVDLAGSERLKDTNAKGDRMKEGTAINNSLSTLAACIKSMTGSSKIPRWRESKITRLLQDSLGGEAYAVIMAAVSPALVNQDESLSTIRFASMAQRIKAEPKQNLDPLTEVNTPRTRPFHTLLISHAMTGTLSRSLSLSLSLFSLSLPLSLLFRAHCPL